MNNEHRYDDIINLPHPTSTRHPRMSLSDRAAQFSPFAALTGHDAAIKETARLTDEKVELDEDAKLQLNEKLQMIRENLGRSQSGNPGTKSDAHSGANPETSLLVTITYFVPDERKSGGAYVSCTGYVKKIDEYGQAVIMNDGAVIPIGQICGIEGDDLSFFFRTAE